ncbi:MAG: sigma-70 family RNA polymerase sigma factor [Candidatus Eisenbacteria bacterium]|jgi:RNA polymerase sigma-70 factor (ECF subfamily)|nr:sigma-70 family RNA polymerase sigma factor [Candidatus Eisenbacteria bacterium]
MELTELLQRCRNGDELAWEALVRTYQGRIYGIAYGYVGNAEEARDLAQEVFVRIYRKLTTCRDPQRFLPWMVRIARGVCVDHLRRAKARPPAHDVPIEEDVSLADDDPNPEQHAITNARKRLVYRGLRTLSVINREIIVLKEMQGLPQEEIASMLKVPLGTVKSRANRARIELAKAILALGGGPELQE